MMLFLRAASQTHTRFQPNVASWLNDTNLWFVDNPVGTGYSYVESNDAYARNVETIASDLVELSIQVSDERIFEAE